MPSLTAVALMKADLGLYNPPEEVLELMKSYLDASVSELDTFHIPFDEPDPAYMRLEVMYASWLYRKRSTDEEMPPMLRYAINNYKVRSTVQEVTG